MSHILKFGDRIRACDTELEVNRLAQEFIHLSLSLLPSKPGGRAACRPFVGKYQAPNSHFDRYYVYSLNISSHTKSLTAAASRGRDGLPQKQGLQMTRGDSRLCATPRKPPDRQLLTSPGWRAGDVKVAVCVALAQKWMRKSVLEMAHGQLRSHSRDTAEGCEIECKGLLKGAHGVTTGGPGGEDSPPCTAGPSPRPHGTSMTRRSCSRRSDCPCWPAVTSP